MKEDHKVELTDGQQMLLGTVCAVGAALLFAMLKPELLRMWRSAAVWHAQVLSNVDQNAAGRAFYSAIGVSGERLARLGQALAARDATELSGSIVWKVSEYIGKVVRWFAAPLLLVLALDVLSYPKRYRRQFSNGAALFRYVQANEGRYLSRVENALKANLYKGSHAVAKTAWQWVSENQCIGADDSLDEARALAALKAQLGVPFTTWDSLIKGKNGWIAGEILGHLQSKTDREGVVAYATQGHRYESTVLVALLLATRRFGVVPCMSFAGLRKVDRPLWYALESAGRRLSFVEACGIMAQYEYEMALLTLGKGKHLPQEGRVDSAIAGLRAALESETKHEAMAGVWTGYDPTKL